MSTRPRYRCSIPDGVHEEGLLLGARPRRPAVAGRGAPAVLYSYAPGRSAEHAAALLKGYTSVLQTDGHAGYRSLADLKRDDGPATLAFVGHIGVDSRQ